VGNIGLDIFIGLLSSSGFTAVLTTFLSRRKDKTEIAGKAAQILNDEVIEPLRKELHRQSEQIKHLEEVQDRHFDAMQYIRTASHWIEQACMALGSAWLHDHPMPRIPDSLKGDVRFLDDATRQHDDESR